MNHKDANSRSANNSSSESNIKNPRFKKDLKSGSIFMTLLPLAACGGGGGGGGTAAPSDNTPNPTPPTTLDPDFTENPTNVFFAVNNSNSTLSEGGNNANLTVTGKAGSDSITTGSGNDQIDGAGGNDTVISNGGADTVIGGSGNDIIKSGAGNDFIRAGEGNDNVDAGAGNDAIVVVGTTTAGQYTQNDINDADGSGTNLSGLINLANLNGRTVSEVVAGEIINGGTGTNSLFIYGTVDLTGVTLNNVTILQINSNVTLTASQMAAFTTVDGDGTSTINIEVPPGDTYTIDLSSLNLTDIGNLNIQGDVTFIVDDADDFNEIGAITTQNSSTVKVEVNGNGGNTTVNLGDIAAKINSVDNVSVATNVTLEIDDADDITNLGLSQIEGSGEVDTNGNNDIQDALDNNVDVNANTVPVAISDNAVTDESTPVTIDVLVNDNDENTDPLAITGANITNGTGAVSIVNNELVYDPDGTYIHLNNGQSADVTIEYQISDGNGGTDTATVTVTVNGADNIINGTDDDDELIAKPGADIITAGNGNDTIFVNLADSPISEDTYSGGDGYDTLVFTGTDEVTPTQINLSDLNSSNIDEIQLSDGMAESITISAADVISIAENQSNTPPFSAYTLWVSGNGEDSVELSDDFVFNSYVLVNGVVYQTYSYTDYTYNDDAGVNVELWISMEIGTITGTFVPAISYLETSPNYWEAQDNFSSALNLSDSTENLTIVGTDGGDVVATGSGNDVINSGNGRNYTAPGAGDDTVIGGTGYDSFRGSEGSDYYDGAEGHDDYIQYGSSPSGVNIDLSMGLFSGGYADGDTLVNIEQVTGSFYADILIGGNANVQLSGGDGNDIVTGGTGHDVLYGNAGVDIVNGGAGDDLLSASSVANDLEDTFDGGAGFDAFRYTPDFSSRDPLTVTMSDFNISNIELFELRNTNLTIEAQDVIDITDENNILYLRMSSFDTSSITTSSGWSYSHSVVLNGQLYHQYISGQATLNLNVNITDLTGITAPAATFSETSPDVYEAIDHSNSSFMAPGTYTDFTINGKDGNDIILGTGGNETINGNNGDDILHGGGGANIISGGAGNDKIILVGGISSLANETIDAGDDIDTLVLNGLNNGAYFGYNGQLTAAKYEVDLSLLNVTNIEHIELKNEVSLTISEQNVFDVTDANNQLKIEAGADDIVTTSDSWTYQNIAYFGDDYYFFFTGQGGASLFISVEVGMLNGFPAPTEYFTEVSPNVFVATNDVTSFFIDKNSTEDLTVTGSNSDDIIRTGAGNDIIRGLAGEDRINPGAGADTIDGGDDIDELNYYYSGSPVGINIDLAAGTGTGGHAEGDIISNIEDVVGTEHDDTITGNSENNELSGWGGNDTLIGGDGNDVLNADLHSKAGDQNHLEGGDGNDYLNGGAGDDTLNGGDGYDHISGGDGDDTINGGYEDDIINAGTGNDTVLGGFGNDRFIINEGFNFTGDSFDGGDGTDTFDFSGVTSFNYSDINGVSIEQIDLRGGSGTEISIETADVDNHFATNTFLNVFGDQNDTFTTTSGWTFIGWGINISNEEITTLYNTGPQTISISAEFGTVNGLTPDAQPYIEMSPNIYEGDGVNRTIFSDKYSDQNITISNTISSALVVTGSGHDNVTLTEGGTVFTGAGDDYVTASDAAISLTVYSSEGADQIVGNAILFNRIYYINSAEGVNVNLQTGLGSGGHAEGDTFSGITYVRGSIFNDVFVGDDNNNEFDGDEGLDNMSGGGGDDIFRIYQPDRSEEDIIDGGEGFDTVTVFRNTAEPAYNLDLGDLDFSNIEKLDFLSGSPDFDVFLSFTADDIISVTDTDNTLFITGDNADIISSTSSWSFQETMQQGDTFFNIFTSGYATIYVEQTIDTNIQISPADFAENSTDVWDAIDDSNSYGSFKTSVNNLTITGKAGDDVIIGGSGVDTINGGDGNDYINGGIGADIINGGLGTDIMIYDAADSYDGGLDNTHDMLKILDSGHNIDLSNVNVTQISVMDIGGDGGNTLTLTAQDVLDVTESQNQLLILGDFNDLVTSTGQGWVYQGDVIHVDGETLHHYFDGQANLYVDIEVSQEIS